MGPWLKKAIILLLLLLRLWLGLWLAKNVIAIRVTVECSLLWLEGRLGLQEVILLPELIVAGLLRGETARISICITSLLWLESGWLSVLIVQVTGGHRLLLIHWVPKPIYCRLLLISLVIPCQLRLSRLHRRGGVVVEQRRGIALFQFTSSKLLFFLTQFYSLGKIVIVIFGACYPFASFLLLFGFMLAGLDCKAVFRILFIIWSLRTIPSWTTARLTAASNAMYSIVDSADTRFPEFPIRAFVS